MSKPVGWVDGGGDLYHWPLHLEDKKPGWKRGWVNLTDEEINHIFAANVGYPERMMDEVAKLLKEKNNG